MTNDQKEVNVEQSPWVRDVGEADFQHEVIEQSRQKPVVVDFWAPWCAPCRMLGPRLEALVHERGGAVLLAKVNVDEAQNVAAEYRVSGIPAVKAIRDGRVVLEFMGALPEADLRAFLDRISPTPADRLAEEARRREDDDPAASEKLYRQALEQDRNHDVALLGLAGVLLARGQDAEAAELLERVTPGGERGPELDRLRGVLAIRALARDFGDAAALRRQLTEKPDNAELHYRLGCVLAAGGKYPEALEELLTAGRADKKLARTPVKEAMVQIFHIVGVRSELADDYRDKLTRLLY
jgi:putative thioredoxin